MALSDLQGLGGSVRLTGCGGIGAVSSYRDHGYPEEIISRCVWLYHRLLLSVREVEEMILAWGVVVCYETIRRWCQKFGQIYANELRRRRPRPDDKWYLDEVFITINGKRQHLGRAVVQDVLVTDKLASYGVAHRRLMRSVEHRRSKYPNNRDVRRTPINPRGSGNGR
jgi:putative transposase